MGIFRMFGYIHRSKVESVLLRQLEKEREDHEERLKKELKDQKDDLTEMFSVEISNLKAKLTLANNEIEEHKREKKSLRKTMNKVMGDAQQNSDIGAALKQHFENLFGALSSNYQKLMFDTDKARDTYRKVKETYEKRLLK